MARTGYALGSPAGTEYGPLILPTGTEVAAIEAAEQHGYGLIDLRIHFRNADGSSIPGNPISGWITDLAPSANFIGTILIPKDELFSGLVVVEQFGFGVVNLRIKKTKRSNGAQVSSSNLIFSNQNQNRSVEVDLPPATIPEGIICKVQAGYGIVDIAIDYK
jgi:hypothetical protein